MLKLFYKGTTIEPVEGDELTDFRGDKAEFCHGVEPRHPGSTGRVYVRPVGSNVSPFGFYPSVFDLEWRETEESAS